MPESQQRRILREKYLRNQYQENSNLENLNLGNNPLGYIYRYLFLIIISYFDRIGWKSFFGLLGLVFGIYNVYN
jgi:hypothetical protein